MAAVLVAGAFVVASCSDIALGKIVVEGDTFWHLTTGEQILATRTFPLVDSYSHTAAGAPWIAYGWLQEVLLAGAARLAGLPGLAWLLWVSTAVLFLLLYYYAWLRSRNVKAAAIASIVAIPMLEPFVSLRPQLPAAVFLLLTLICLEHFREGRHRALWFLPPLFVLWVNIHGSFVLGLAVMGFYWAAALFDINTEWLYSRPWSMGQRHRFAAVFLGCVLALCLTPYGTRLAAYPFEFSLFQGNVERMATEWQPLRMGQGYSNVFIGVLLLLVAVQMLRPSRQRLEDLILFLGAAFYTCLHARFLVVFVLVAVPMIAAALTPYLPQYDRSKDKPLLNLVLIAAILGATTILFPSRHRLHEVVGKNFPEKALVYLQQNPPLHLFNEDDWGKYLIWATHGGSPKVFVDGRLDIYQYTGVLFDYVSARDVAPTVAFILRKYDIDTVLLHRDQPLASYLAVSAGWQRVYQDDITVVFRRTPVSSR